MSRNFQLYLTDIVSACEKVLRDGMTFEQFVADATRSSPVPLETKPGFWRNGSGTPISLLRNPVSGAGMVVHIMLVCDSAVEIAPTLISDR